MENKRIPPDPFVGAGPLLMPLEPIDASSVGTTETIDAVAASVSMSTSGPEPHTKFLSPKQYMLGLINAERQKAGLRPVTLGTNNAAQIHAENLWRDCVSGHWGTDGLTPYMRYSLAGGYQSNSENVSGYRYCFTDEDRNRYRAISNVQSELRDIMTGLMGSPGHARNILKPWHRKVNLGLAWTTHQMWTVQHFQGDYADCSVRPKIEGTTLNMNCTVKEVLQSNYFYQAIHYDPPPTELTRGQIARSSPYRLGNRVAYLREQPPRGRYWTDNEAQVTHYSGCTPYDIVSTAPPPSSLAQMTLLHNEAKLCEPTETTVSIPIITGTETISGSSITLSHDIGSVLSSHGSGVYTVLVWGCSVPDSVNNRCPDDNSLIIIEESIFYGIDPPSTYTVGASTGTPTPTPTPAATPTQVPAPLQVDCGSAVTDTSNTGLVADCEALLSLKDTLRGTAILNWSSGLAITRWTGVQLGGSPRRVVSVKLQNRGLNGSIPAEIGRLSKLQHLWLYNNTLTGSLPSELGNLADLETLMLSNNRLSGQIPETLNNLTLSRMWLKRNSFTGCMPANLLNVAGGDAASLNLPVCSGSGQPAPTGTPAATPTPTPTPSSGGSDDMTLLTAGHCTAADIASALGGTYTRTDYLPFVQYEHNGLGLESFRKSEWAKSNDSSKTAYCLTVLYDNGYNAALDTSYYTMRSLVEGTLDVLAENKIRDLPELGHDFIGLHVQLGDSDADGDRRIRESQLDVVPWEGTTVVMLRRGKLALLVSESSWGTGVDESRPPAEDGVVSISRLIDSRLASLGSLGVGSNSVSAEGFDVSGKK